MTPTRSAPRTFKNPAHSVNGATHLRNVPVCLMNNKPLIMRQLGHHLRRPEQARLAVPPKQDRVHCAGY